MNILKIATGRRLVAGLGVSLALMLAAPYATQAQTPTCVLRVTNYATFTACSGTLTDGNPYLFRVPTNWNGTLVIFSQGYSSGPFPLPAFLNQPVSQWLVANGAAVSTSFGGSGWALHEAMRNQIETLDILTSLYGAPTRTIAYGGSLGGIISAGLVQQHPERFAGGLSAAGPLAGAVGTWNQALDFAFVVRQLLGPESGLEIIHITDGGTPTSGNWGLASQMLTTAQDTPEGRARLALASAVFDVPGWFDPLTPEPAADDYATREYNQFLWARDVLAGQMFGYGRTDLEARAGGNPSWNTDVNYEVQLDESIDYAEVVALYGAAGLSLEEDLARLNTAPRIAADPGTLEYVNENIVFDGDLGGVPLLALHTTGDGLIVEQHEFAYRSAALEAQDSQLLRQVFVHRGGHDQFTSAELMAAFQALFRRIDTGKWGGSTSPEGLNAAAETFGATYNVLFIGGNLIPTPPAYFPHDPAPYLRPYDLAGTNSLAGRAPVPGAVSAAIVPLSAWPSPYRGGSLQISFARGAGVDAKADVAIYDVLGRRLRQLTSADRNGSQSLQWDGRDAKGVPVGSGIYFVRATQAGHVAKLKLVVLR